MDFYAITVGRGSPCAYVADPGTARAFIDRYLRACWPKASPTPAETYEYGASVECVEYYHPIPPSEYTGGEMLPVTVARVDLWTPDSVWPKPLDGGD